VLPTAWILFSVLALQAPAAPAGAPPQAPPPSPDPAVAAFSTGLGLLLVPVKSDKTSDYEAVMVALQAAFAASTDPERRAVAQGWRVFKAAEADARGNALYVHALLPVVAGTDYRPSLWLDQLMQDAPTELLAKYKDALAGSPTRLSLAEVANMAVAPVKK
jgi:hypothetical protein